MLIVVVYTLTFLTGYFLNAGAHYALTKYQVRSNVKKTMTITITTKASATTTTATTTMYAPRYANTGTNYSYI